MKDPFERLAECSYGTLSGIRPHQKIVIDELLKLWREMHDQGVCAYDFAHALKNVSQDVMLQFDTLEGALKFGEAQKEDGAAMIRAVTTHWSC